MQNECYICCNSVDRNTDRYETELCIQCFNTPCIESNNYNYLVMIEIDLMNKLILY